MPSIVWKGHFTFGLVSIPVKLYRAARRERVHYVHRPEVSEESAGEREVCPPEVPPRSAQRAPQRVAAFPMEAEREPPEPAPSAPISRVHQALVTSEERAIPRAEVLREYEVSRLPARFGLVLVCCAMSGFAQDILKAPIAAVDFYGEAKVDFAQLRAASPFRVGAPIKIEDIALPPDALRKLAGDNRISANSVFSPELNGWIVYVDIEPPHSELPAWKAGPSGSVKLPPEQVALYEHAMSRLMEGGVAAGDETTEGYSLSKDPQMRADEQKLLAYARANAAAVFDVLAHSSSGRDRIAAAWIAGYAPQNQDQIAALLDAINDPDATVRNNAVRVLAALAYHDADIARQIPVEPFIRMLHSPDWTDRNKAMALLDPITVARDPRTLESLRRQALEPLRQMSRWTAWGHAQMAARLLGRASGIPENRLRALLEAKDVSMILRESGR